MRFDCVEIDRSRWITRDPALLGGYWLEMDGIWIPWITVLSGGRVKLPRTPFKPWKDGPDGYSLGGDAIHCPEGIFVRIECRGDVRVCVYFRQVKDLKQDFFHG